MWAVQPSVKMWSKTFKNSEFLCSIYIFLMARMSDEQISTI